MAARTAPGKAKTVLVEENHLDRTISHVQFGMFGAKEIAGVSEFEVVQREFYEPPSKEKPARTPMAFGVLDRRLGISDKQSICETCGERLDQCPGHFAHIKLELPVYHIGYIKTTVAVLQCICKVCSRVLLPQSERPKILRALSNPMARRDAVKLAAVFKRVVERCKKVRECPFCDARNGVVKKVGFAHIVHEKYKENEKKDDAVRERQEFHNSFESTLALPKGSFENSYTSGADLRAILGKAQEDLNPLRVRSLFRAIPVSELAFLDMSSVNGPPEALLVDNLLVPPVPIRPSVMADASIGSNEDDLTVKLAEIVAVNNIIRGALQGGKANIQTITEDWDYLQLQAAMYINGQNVPSVKMEWQGEKKPIRAFAQRLKGKSGRFRGNLSGKRVDFSGRTVISPDPNLAINEVGVPMRVAMILTYPQKVFSSNIGDLRAAILKGPSEWPGANYVETSRGKRSLKFGDRRRVAQELQIGDTVERHMTHGDVVLFNRQPSLHKLSIMAHRARVVPHRTFRFNECVCAPYNADFDGDEMNLHMPQTEEARVEASELMGVHHNLITPRNGEIVVAATQDFLTGAYLLSKQGLFLTRDQFARIVSYLSDATELIELPPPAILKPIELFTGKQVFTCMLRPSRHCALHANLETKNKSYNPKRQKPEPKYMCPADGYVCFQNSEHMCGSLDKALLGGGNKTGLFAVLFREHSAEVSAQAMQRLAKVTARFLADYGFSIGINDVQPTAALSSAKGTLLGNGYEACRERIADFTAGRLTPSPGCTAEQTLESEINGMLSKIRDDAGEICKRELHSLNAPLTMATCGSKGSFINISQMIACVGQQSLGGRRMPNGFIHRSLPHFPRHSREAPDKGFVANSFYTGLTPTEFFFHTMGGREGLVDTAVKTAETGYMARRLMKALEDLTVLYDLSVRNSAHEIVQFRYGDDGLDPASMEEKDGRPVNFARTLLHQRALFLTRTTARRATSPVLTVSQLFAQLEVFMQSAAFKAAVKRNIANEPSKFEAELYKFVADEVAPHARPDGAKEETRDKLEKRERGGAGDQPVKEAPPVAAGKRRAGARRIVEDHDEEDEAEEVKREPKGEVKRESGEGQGGLEGQMADESKFEVKAEPGVEPGVEAGVEQGVRGAAAAASPMPLELEPDPEPRYLMTRAEFGDFLRKCLDKYQRAQAEPATAVGAVGAQSIGEPGTQMTLKTFHFAGVASMNITQGVPRIKEIINAAKTVSTPIIKAELVDPYDLEKARVVKGRIERTFLSGVCSCIEEIFDVNSCFVSVKLDLKNIRKLYLNVHAHSVRQSILAAPKLKLKENEVMIASASEIRINPPRTGRDDNVLLELHRLNAMVQDIIVCGIKEVTRAIITQKEDGEKTAEEKKAGRPCYRLLVEGAGLLAVMGTEGVRGDLTRSNHIMEVEKTQGVEAARQTIMDEIQYTMGQHGMDIDSRHVSLLSDIMSFRGEILGITRFGVPRMKQSVLMLASFEKTTDHLFEAAVHSREDAINGVSECIIMGIPIRLGTGLFKLLQRVPRITLPKSEPLLLPSLDKRVRLA